MPVERPSAAASPPSAPVGTTRILVRATTLDDSVVAFAAALANATGYPVSFVLDARKAKVDAPGRSVVGVSDEACRSLGLYCPPEYPWQCGDYGYYLARERFPDARFLWMIEYDVRFATNRVADFFAFFEARPDVDFLTTGLEAADRFWYWTATCRGSDVTPYRCLFPVTRLTDRAVDALRNQRVAHSRRIMRRLSWPNDEGMVATTLLNADFVCRDFNAFDRSFYDATTFSFKQAIDGDSFDTLRQASVMFHPVLFGKQYRDKLARLVMDEVPKTFAWRVVRRLTTEFNKRRAW